jgi:hypothetical protein
LAAKVIGHKWMILLVVIISVLLISSMVIIYYPAKNYDASTPEGSFTCFLHEVKQKHDNTSLKYTIYSLGNESLFHQGLIYITLYRSWHAFDYDLRYIDVTTTNISNLDTFRLGHTNQDLIPALGLLYNISISHYCLLHYEYGTENVEWPDFNENIHDVLCIQVSDSNDWFLVPTHAIKNPQLTFPIPS